MMKPVLGRRFQPLATAAFLATSTVTAASGFVAGPKLLGAGGVGSPKAGNSVALSADGSTALVGAPGDASNSGAVWVFVRAASHWTQQGGKLVGTGAAGATPTQGTGVALSADGNTAFVGAGYDNGGMGAAWAFTRSAGTWTQQGGKLVGSAVGASSYHGNSVALSADGNTAAVGGLNDGSGAGAVWIYVRSSGTWTQQGNKLIAAGSSSLGSSVAISSDGNTVVASAAAGAWVFTRSGTTWSQQGGKLTAPGAAGIGGAALSADGNTALVGSPNYGSFAGAAFVFTRSNGTWTQTDAIQGTGAIGTAYQGIAVALSADGRAALVGGGGDNAHSSNVGIGAAWSFRRTTGAFSQDGPKLLGMAETGDGWFGYSVALTADGSTALVGGPADHTNVGAAWVFMRNCTADVNGDGLTNVSDVFYLINFLFAGGPAPACF